MIIPTARAAASTNPTTTPITVSRVAVPLLEGSGVGVGVGVGGGDGGAGGAGHSSIGPNCGANETEK